MATFDVPRLVPQPVSFGACSDSQEVAVPSNGDSSPRRRRVAVRAGDVLGIPVTYLDPGELLDDAVVVTLAAGSFVFAPCVKKGWGLDFTPAQKAQMVAIYRNLPYGAKGKWIARHGLSNATMFKWGQRLGLPSAAEAKLDALTEDISSRLSPRAMTYLVRSYAALPAGEKGAFLVALGLTHMEMSKWIAKVADGSIEQYALKRKADIVGSGTHDDPTRSRKQVERMLAENDRLKRELAKANQKLQRQDAELDKWRQTSDALGKALASMPDLPGVDYDAEENPYPKTKHAAMKLVSRKNNASSTPSSPTDTP
ncbi:hypothetical protein JKI95_05765 [Corynebacterium aquatimens]|uniref:guanine nucleotide-binding protein subunit gamma n=1 Tax=Corynebacterium TaxID=1716 RepID=UPI001F1F340E|nr:MULTISPECIES: guanine nucleotide-binding protein subunit gamma [Corynebacterium]QYH18963.1 hypothetical protein JKI95_06430 [Corynebacterium aquatimens]QYH19168.1 hypothetical protein JKI95_08020 [Corynebacterium aquatimens]QYH20368.1 hypothetical protein JKI95_05765 [Corynebacterium aquatimens]UIZ91954.1 hypothetical protein JZY91_09760 [Corynebacterium sp. CNCTC7651]UIZ92200.1 hypothetical protein JZY91_11270 [Corynebacterium sp. CNCTC7651]